MHVGLMNRLTCILVASGDTQMSLHHRRIRVVSEFLTNDFANLKRKSFAGVFTKKTKLREATFRVATLTRFTKYLEIFIKTSQETLS